MIWLIVPLSRCCYQRLSIALDVVEFHFLCHRGHLLDHVTWDPSSTMASFSSVAVGKNDEIIPYTHSIKLFQKANEPKKHVLVDEAMHNNLYDFNIDKDVISFIDSL